MNNDHFELLARIDENVKSIKEWSTNHQKSNDDKFKQVDRNFVYGAIAIIIVALASGVLPEVLKIIK